MTPDDLAAKGLRVDSLRALYEATKNGIWLGMSSVPDDFRTDMTWKAFNGSLDAALALHKSVLPGWRVLQLHQFEAGHWLAGVYHPQGDDWPKWTPYPKAEETAPDPARALVLADLAAMIDLEGEG